VTCGYENKALRAITPQENFERIFFETITGFLTPHTSGYHVLKKLERIFLKK
jgi:hypothetical protein